MVFAGYLQEIIIYKKLLLLHLYFTLLLSIIICKILWRKSVYSKATGLVPAALLKTDFLHKHFARVLPTFKEKPFPAKPLIGFL